MREGWAGDDYLVLFSDSEVEGGFDVGVVDSEPSTNDVQHAEPFARARDEGLAWRGVRLADILTFATTAPASPT